MLRAALVLILLSAPLLPALAANQVVAKPDVLVAVLDTGADVTHPEFGGYLGEAGVADPQVVGWWDFGEHGNPAPGQRWDPRSPVPFDTVGHGTGTASLVGGRTLGTCPGVKLALAKLTDAKGNFTGDIAAAVDWAVTTMGADVVSISFGTTLPTLAALDGMDEALSLAWREGALPVASAGNGLLNNGVKEPSELHSPGGSPYAFTVGASTRDGSALGTAVGSYYSNLDPQVLAWGTEVPMAAPGGGTATESGTSFATPKVAGYAACLTRAALASGQDAGPARIQRLLEWTARDSPLVPYALEGYGFVDDATYARALGDARSGIDPPRPDALNAALDGNDRNVKLAWTETLDWQSALVRDDAARPGVLAAPSLPQGATRVALYHAAVQPGQVLRAHLGYVQRANPGDVDQDLDLYLFAPGADRGLALSQNDLLARSIQAPAPPPAASGEDVERTMGLGGDAVLAVVGYMAVADQPFDLDATLDGQPAPVAWAGGALAVGDVQGI